MPPGGRLCCLGHFFLSEDGPGPTHTYFVLQSLMDSIPGYYVFFYKAYSDPMTEVNVSVKEEKKNRFYVFYFLNKSLCSLIFTCLIFFS